MATIGIADHAEFLDVTRAARERFADIHSYEIVERATSLDPTRPPAWSKVLLVRELLDDHGTVVWIDADAVPVSFDVDIATETDQDTPLHAVTHDFGDQLIPNTGVMVVRRTVHTVALLDTIWDQTEFIDHRWWENAAVLSLMGFDLTEPIARTGPDRLDGMVGALDAGWNAIPQTPRQPTMVRMVHFPGYPNDVRGTLLEALVADPGSATEVLSDPLAAADRLRGEQS
jgi:hypothetical protein